MSRKLIAIMLIAVLVLVGCADETPLDKNTETIDPERVEEVEINGLPCIVVTSDTSHGYDVVSIDCDWSVRD